MWSHTIQSSAKKSTNPPAQRPARAGNNLKKSDDAITTPEEDMTKGFDADGFSKTSKVFASKKPLTVAKAPSFGRTTSRVGQPTTSVIDTPRKDGQSKSTQPVKSTPRASISARVPQTATPTQSSARASKTGTPLRNKPPVTSPKHTTSSGRLANTSTPNGSRSAGSENAAPGLDTHKPDEPGETLADEDRGTDENNVDDVSRAKELPDDQGLEGLKHTIAVKDGEIQDLQDEIQVLQSSKDAQTQELQAYIKNIQTTNDYKNEEMKAAFLAQIAPLESEVGDARKRISHLEATHRKTQEDHDQVLLSKDEEIQRLSATAFGQRGEQEAKESVLSLKSEFQGLQIKHKRELDEAAATASAKLEAIQADHDELLQSRDREILEMSDLAQELQEKVEKAHQADKDELKEAEKRHEQEIQDKVKQHEQELRDVTTRNQQALRDGAGKYEREVHDAVTKHAELQENVSHLEQELRDAAAKHLQEMNDAKEEHQTTLRDATQRHERESTVMSSKYKQELEELILTHHEEIKSARTRSAEASEESAVKHQQEIEALIAKQKEELEAAAVRQEQAFGDAAAKYQKESQSLEAKHLEELRTATTRDGQASEDLATRHQQEIQVMTAKHQEELGRIVTTNEQELGNATIKSQQAVESIRAQHQEELASAASQIEELRSMTQRNQHELGDVAQSHKQELGRVNHEHQQELLGVATKYAQDIKDANAKYKELEDLLAKKEENLREAGQKHKGEIARLENQLGAAAANVTSLETTLRDLSTQREVSGREAASKYEQELQTATLKYEEELQSLRTIYATTVEEIATLRQTLQDVEQKQREAVEEELQSLRIIYATAVEEITALRRKVEDVDQKRIEAVEEVASLKASFEGVGLKQSEAVGQVPSLQSLSKEEELERSEAAIELALLRDKLELADRRFEQDQQAVSDLQRQNRGLQAQVAEMSTDTSLDRNEAAVDAALLKDKLELADLEIHLHKGTISALQNEIERLQTPLVEQSADTDFDRDEAVLDVALLKDKLELANIQIRQAKGTVSNLQEEIEGLKTQITDSTVGMDLDQNEAAVEIALLKNTLELANLESYQDKATITTLQKQVEGLQAQVTNIPKTGSYTHHQLRGELSMLGRHQAAQMTDLEALQVDMAAESNVREQEWKKRAEVWDRFASELQGMKTHLVGTVDGVSRVG
ncbi:hypothetical protein IMSHALPRED_011064 [Imshaugia aleurites]|uniref:Uncharacterized protein n=1 Tax=Imshaugia aleurites TaxID=172621 RepID=A0A8H3GC87_9LECA|nr:hypothetical protein IMSHALPRED_011064 [Imshaugia aleurites]